MAGRSASMRAARSACAAKIWAISMVGGRHRRCESGFGQCHGGVSGKRERDQSRAGAISPLPRTSSKFPPSLLCLWGLTQRPAAPRASERRARAESTRLAHREDRRGGAAASPDRAHPSQAARSACARSWLASVTNAPRLGRALVTGCTRRRRGHWRPPARTRRLARGRRSPEAGARQSGAIPSARSISALHGLGQRREAGEDQRLRPARHQISRCAARQGQGEGVTGVSVVRGEMRRDAPARRRSGGSAKEGGTWECLRRRGKPLSPPHPSKTKPPPSSSKGQRWKVGKTLQSLPSARRAQLCLGPNDDVVVQRQPEVLAPLLDLLGHAEIGLRRRGVARRVVVDQDKGAGGSASAPRLITSRG